MSYMDIALIVLVIAGVWAVIEVALTLRTARKRVDEVAASANEVIAQTQPIVAKLDGMVDELQPAVKEVPALMENVTVAVDSANDSLTRVNAILDDVSAVSGTASAVTETVNGAVSGVANAVVGAVSKVGGLRGGSAPAAQLSEGAEHPEHVEPAAASTHGPVTYVDYASLAGAHASETAGEKTDDAE